MFSNNKESESAKFSTYVTVITPSVTKAVMDGLSFGRSVEEINADIYHILTKTQFDTKAFDYIYDAVKVADPKLTREKFLKEFTNRKVKGKGTINLFDNIDNQATTNNIYRRVDSEFKILNTRVNRLKSYRNYTGASSFDMSRSIETIRTDANYIKGDINNLKRKVKFVKDSSLKREMKKDIARLTKEYNLANSTNRKLEKMFKSMDKMDDADPRKMVEYKKLVKSIESDIEIRKKPLEVSKAIQSSKEQVKTIAITETQHKRQQLGIEEGNTLKSELKEDEILLIKISLNPRRSWIGHDICDDITSRDMGYGKGVYEYKYALKSNIIPPEHPRCQCRFEYIKRKKS